MINYSQFNTTNDHAYNIARAIAYCKKNNIDGIKFEKGTYELSPKLAMSGNYCVSNHTLKGSASTAFLLDSMENFTIDGGGSTFISDGVLVGFAVCGSKNITIKNLLYTVKNTLRMTARVVRVDKRDIEITITNGQDYYISGGKLRFTDGHGHDDPQHFIMSINMDGHTGYMKNIKQYLDSSLNMYFQYLPNGNILIRETAMELPVGTNFVITARPRHGCNILIDNSINTTISDFSMRRGYAMGIIGQFSENVIMRGIDVRCNNGEIISLNADATHFVSCTGTIEITDSYFEGMLDDALNVHGIFTRIEDIDENGILVHDLHPMAKGFKLYKKGSKIAVMSPDFLIPRKEFTVETVTIINDEYTYLTLGEKVPDEWLGDTVEELTMYPKIVFKNNDVRENRARGILLASKGDTLIEGNRFHTPGPSIKLESDGEYWYESGSVGNVVIRNNTFDDCNFAGELWGPAVITIPKRKSFDGKNFYHKHITITGNKFIGNKKPVLSAANVGIIEFTHNFTEGNTVYTDCGEIIENDNQFIKNPIETSDENPTSK